MVSPSGGSRGELLRESLDVVSRLNAQRRPWRVIATDVWMQQGHDLLRIDLLVECVRRSWYVAVVFAPGSGDWAFVRHPAIDRNGSSAVYVDGYEIADGDITARPWRLTYSSNVFRLALDGGGPEAPAGPVSPTTDPAWLSQAVLRSQDAVATTWLIQRLARMQSSNPPGQAARGGTLVSVLLTHRALRAVSWPDANATPPQDAESGPPRESDSLDWLWCECSCVRDVGPRYGKECSLPWGFEPELTRHLAVARPLGLESLLKSDGWPDFF